ncbi:hypothetical protein [Stutzerimonas stutzeri]|uniref:hypothetical protein n=1 Tax=Stutzerimonas stutzeri TaxID=316 RepID=UPI00210DCEFE|nr:hypothetical protein [Stutzerimonas stutzeri]MCQ4319719.1 hypothetical protein [Stutzerimonas stutzeri]
MANVNETSQWESGVYQIETTDPVLGGANGIANVQARQLANRTAYLKARADLVDQAKGATPSLPARLVKIESDLAQVDVDSQDTLAVSTMYALEQAAVANRSVRALKQQIQQEGELLLENRGIVRGCTATKSTVAARNLNLAAGVCFARGRAFSVNSGENVASVPSNIGSGSATVQAYLFNSAAGWRMAITAIGEALPAGAIRLYSITIPAGNTDATDPNLTNVTLTSVRRVEAGFPIYLDSPATRFVPINTLSANDYRLDLDVVSAVGAPCDNEAVNITSRATNGFTLELASAADDIRLRYRVSKLNN